MRETTITTTKDCQCDEGFYKTVSFNFILFTINKRFFLCEKCHDLIPVNRMSKDKFCTIEFM